MEPPPKIKVLQVPIFLSGALRIKFTADFSVQAANEMSAQYQQVLVVVVFLYCSG